MIYSDDGMFKFQLSVSKQTLISKPVKGSKEEKDFYKFLRFEEKNISIEEFTSLIKKFHSFAHIFDYEGKELTCKRKNNRNFREANVIFIDVDDCDKSMSETLFSIKYKPTVSYSTASNNLEGKGYRFRFCYIFNESIKNINIYKNLYKEISFDVKQVLSLSKMKDDSGKKVSQVFHGSLPNCEIKTTNIIYEVSDFPEYVETEEKITHKNQKINLKDVEIDPVFKEDCELFSIPKMLTKYSITYHYYDKTEIDFNDDEYYKWVNKAEYHKIYRMYERKMIKGNLRSVVKKWSHGNKRINKLFISGIIMKEIKNDITVEHLAFNLMYEVFRNYDNTISEDNKNEKFTPTSILNIAINIITSDYKLEQKPDDSGKKMILKIDIKKCKEEGISYQSKVAEGYKIERDKEILNVLDTSISLKENFILLNESGIKVSMKVLKRIYNDYNLKDYSLFERLDQLYDTSISPKTNYLVICSTSFYFKVSLMSLYNYCKDRNINTKCSNKSGIPGVCFQQRIINNSTPNIFSTFSNVSNTSEFLQNDTLLDNNNKKEEQYYTASNDFVKIEISKVNKEVKILNYSLLEADPEIEITNVEHIDIEIMKKNEKPITPEMNTSPLFSIEPIVYEDGNEETVQETYDEDEIEISKGIIRNYHQKLKGLKDRTDLDMNQTLVLCNSYLYYIECNCKCLTKECAEKTLNACKAIIQSIEDKFHEKESEPIIQEESAKQRIREHYDVLKTLPTDSRNYNMLINLYYVHYFQIEADLIHLNKEDRKITKRCCDTVLIRIKENHTAYYNTKVRVHLDEDNEIFAPNCNLSVADLSRSRDFYFNLNNKINVQSK
ncbi:hypothetical protein EZS27_008671 [termite gut metagenome]|uniref:Uncharacterized protein n=1 Tax=termite gut metagenome TaxID=433724 RepID=A0A5J4SC50_9ZZZZ